MQKINVIIEKLKKDKKINNIKNDFYKNVYLKKFYDEVRDKYPMGEGYALFKLKIIDIAECEGLYLKAYTYISNYIKSLGENYYTPFYMGSERINIYSLDNYVEMILNTLIIKPIWDGFLNEEVSRIVYSKEYNCEFHPFKDEETEFKFEVEYKVDSLIRLPNHNKWSGIQHKCRTFLLSGIDVRSDYFYAHKRCLEENSRYIDAIYFSFYEPKQPYTLLYLHTYKRIDGAELDNLLVPTKEIIDISEQSKIAKVDYYDFSAKYPHLF